MPTTTVDVYKVPRDLSDRYLAYTFSFQVFGTNTEHAVGIASDGLYHYFITDVQGAGFTGAIILKIDPTTGDEIDRAVWTTGAENHEAYDICLRRAHLREPNRTRHGLEGYILWKESGTVKISKLTIRESLVVEVETLTTTVNVDARGICLRGPYIHVIHNNAGFGIYHDVYDIDTGDRILQNVLPLGMTGPVSKAGVIYDGLYFVHHLDPIPAFGFPNRRYRVNWSSPSAPPGSVYDEIRAVDMGVSSDFARHSITWDREFIYDFESEIA
jgi:hypothetical protein